MSAHKTKEEAIETAQEVLNKMKSTGWKMRIWENSGWHCSLVHSKRKLELSTSFGDEFYCMVNPSYSFWTSAKTFKDPNAAVNHAIRYARKILNEFINIIDAAESV